MSNSDPELEETATSSVARRRPVFTVMALVFALAQLTLSLVLLASGKGAGFEGFGAMLMASVIAVVGVGPVLIFLLVATLRKEPMPRVKWSALAVSMLGIFLILAG